MLPNDPGPTPEAEILSPHPPLPPAGEGLNEGEVRLNLAAPDEPAPVFSRRIAESVRGLMPVAMLGILVVLLALLAMQWPTPDPFDAATTTQPHPMRVLARISSGDIAGAVLDSLIYGMLIAALLCIVVIVRQRRRSWLGGLLIVGLLGLAYTSSMALYNGPMISVCGFSLILSGALVAWAAATPDDRPESRSENRPEKSQGHAQPEDRSEDGPENRPEENLAGTSVSEVLESGKDSDASHSTA